MEQKQTSSTGMIAVIRLKGEVDVPGDVEHALQLLGLRSRHSCVVLRDSPSLRGTLSIVKDWVAWGEIDGETLLLLLRGRGRLSGGRPLTDDAVKASGWNSLEEFVNDLMQGKASLKCGGKGKCLKGLKPFFRLHPPKGGLKGIKANYGNGGDLGYRGGGINELLRRMI